MDTPWLARETDGELPATLAGLPVEASARPESGRWRIARMPVEADLDP